MYREAWRLQRDQFWTADMSKVNWQAVYDRYLPLVEAHSTARSFSDLMWEMQGELGTSHAYDLAATTVSRHGTTSGCSARILFTIQRLSWKIQTHRPGRSLDDEGRSSLAAPPSIFARQTRCWRLVGTISMRDVPKRPARQSIGGGSANHRRRCQRQSGAHGHGDDAASEFPAATANGWKQIAAPSMRARRVGGLCAHPLTWAHGYSEFHRLLPQRDRP